MIPVKKTDFQIYASTHPGKGGEKNEDRFRVEHLLTDEESRTDSVLAVLADGIGARVAGEVAAELAVDVICEAVTQSDASQPTGILEAGIIQASRTIRFRSEERREWQGMGSTCLAIWVVGRRLYTASVGNSRLFLLRQGSLHQLNVVRRLPGKSTQAKRSKNEDPLEGYLGSKSRVDVDFRLVVNERSAGRGATRNQGLRLQPGDSLLLCSDGLGDTLTRAEILEAFATHKPELVADSLVNFALQKGTGQNVTALVVRAPSVRSRVFAQPLNWQRPLATAVAAAALVVLGLFAWWFWLGRIETALNELPALVETPIVIPTHTAIP
jgi:protein phosphatase